MSTTEFSLAQRLSATDGMITLSGAHALLRIPADQYRVDKAKGLSTATLVSGDTAALHSVASNRLLPNTRACSMPRMCSSSAA